MRWKPLLCFLLVATTLAVYWRTGNHAFLNYDDDTYVTGNLYINGGLSLGSFRWAFFALHEANWHPLTWLSHMADVQLFGLQPRGHHLTSVVLHGLNALLLMLLLCRMTGMAWRSFMVAALFALHPLHVESVAWVAERKDVLSGLFWLLSLHAYASYAARPRWPVYLLTLTLFVLGLMAKPMVVTLPLVLLLLDYWPLGRVNHGWRENLPRLVLEKLPFIFLSACSAMITVIAQQRGGALVPVEYLPLGQRLANGCVSYLKYLGKMCWPDPLGVLYLYPGHTPSWQVVGALLLLVGLTMAMLCLGKTRRYLIVGWLWYLVTLLPVIGVVQVGQQAMADRYTYLPLIGPFIMVAWGVPELFARWRWRRPALIVLSVIMLVGLTAVTRVQLGYWRNSVTLFTHTLSLAPDNFVAHLNLGNALVEEGRFVEAIPHLLKGVELRPTSAEAHYDLGNALVGLRRYVEAVASYRQALRINPGYAMAHNNLGTAHERLGQTAEAILHYRKALRLDPGDDLARQNLGRVLQRQ